MIIPLKHVNYAVGGIIMSIMQLTFNISTVHTIATKRKMYSRDILIVLLGFNVVHYSSTILVQSQLCIHRCLILKLSNVKCLWHDKEFEP